MSERVFLDKFPSGVIFATPHRLCIYPHLPLGENVFILLRPEGVDKSQRACFLFFEKIDIVGVIFIAPRAMIISIKIEIDE